MKIDNPMTLDQCVMSLKPKNLLLVKLALGHLANGLEEDDFDHEVAAEARTLADLFQDLYLVASSQSKPH